MSKCTAQSSLKQLSQNIIDNQLFPFMCILLLHFVRNSQLSLSMGPWGSYWEGLVGVQRYFVGNTSGVMLPLSCIYFQILLLELSLLVSRHSTLMIIYYAFCFYFLMTAQKFQSLKCASISLAISCSLGKYFIKGSRRVSNHFLNPDPPPSTFSYSLL